GSTQYAVGKETIKDKTKSKKKTIEKKENAIREKTSSDQHTYRELNRRANHLAHHLQEKGFTPGTVAAMAVPPSVETVITIIAIWKAGGIYLPIDLTFPMERILYMLKDSNARLLIKKFNELYEIKDLKETKKLEKSKEKDESGKEIEIIDIHSIYGPPVDTHSEPGPKHQPSSIRHPATGIAYMIYTSGSTGKPKGVAVPHSAFVNRLDWLQRNYGFSGSDVFIQKTPLTFDVSVCELFRWIPGGGRVVIMKPGGEKDPEEMLETVAKHGATTIDFVPSILNLFLEYIENNNALPAVFTLRWVFVGVEALSLELVKTFNQGIYKQTGARLINAYGPTEATVDITWFDCSTLGASTKEDIESVPIGRPIQNTQIIILDKNGNFQPERVPGELFIAGKSLALGYLNNPELTSELFTKANRQLTVDSWQKE
ncbi:MAG: AMP-binding protein, partial [bacterium]|nr:AMP-binding protein [bacterium]